MRKKGIPIYAKGVFSMSNQQKPKKNIELGKFYFIHDGSKTGHPGLVVFKDDENNRYLVIRTDSDKVGDIPKEKRGVKHITKLSHTTDDKIVNSYVRNRPMLCKRKDFGTIDLSHLRINKEDQHIVDMISKRTPQLSPSLKNKK